MNVIFLNCIHPIFHKHKHIPRLWHVTQLAGTVSLVHNLQGIILTAAQQEADTHSIIPDRNQNNVVSVNIKARVKINKR